LAGAYNTNVIRFTSEHFDQYKVPVNYVAVGRKGRDLLIRRGQRVIADFSNLPAAPSFMDVSSIGRLIIDEFLQEKVNEVFLIYTNFINMTHQITTMKQVLPLDLKGESRVQEFESHSTNPRAAYEYEPDQRQLLDHIIPHFTALQVYQAILESLASEHAARMMAMHSATDNAKELAREYALEYNKVRQQAITNDILDIVGGAEAQAR
jgi:F-type H+-transporting ATPase subunit gamma